MRYFFIAASVRQKPVVAAPQAANDVHRGCDITASHVLAAAIFFIARSSGCDICLSHVLAAAIRNIAVVSPPYHPPDHGCACIKTAIFFIAHHAKLRYFFIAVWTRWEYCTQTAIFFYRSLGRDSVPPTRSCHDCDIFLSHRWFIRPVL